MQAITGRVIGCERYVCSQKSVSVSSMFVWPSSQLGTRKNRRYDSLVTTQLIGLTQSIRKKVRRTNISAISGNKTRHKKQDATHASVSTNRKQIKAEDGKVCAVHVVSLDTTTCNYRNKPCITRPYRMVSIRPFSQSCSRGSTLNIVSSACGNRCSEPIAGRPSTTPCHWHWRPSYVNTFTA